MKPLVSVVMPVQNGGKYLDQAVTSILTQTWESLELILIDDRSTDASIAALDKSDPRLSIFPCRGEGVADAFNTGLTHAQGGFIARMDADDIALPERLSCQLDYLQRHPEVDIAGSCVEIFRQRYPGWFETISKLVEFGP